MIMPEYISRSALEVIRRLSSGGVIFGRLCGLEKNSQASSQRNGQYLRALEGIDFHGASVIYLVYSGWSYKEIYNPGLHLTALVFLSE